MKNRIIAGLILSLTTWIVPDAKLSFSGYYKSFYTGLFPPHYRVKTVFQNNPALGIATSRLRLNLLYSPTEKVTFNLSYDFSSQLGETGVNQEASLFYAEPEASYRIADLNQRLYPGEENQAGNLFLTHNIDRCYIAFSLNFADIYLGRQAISWGSAHFINPTDIISPFTFNQLDVEERRGVDALRIRIPLGVIDEIDVGYVFGNRARFENSAFFVKGKFSFLKSDVTFLVLGFRRHLMLGFDLTRSVGGAGVWVEAAYVINYFFSSPPATEADPDYFRMSLGVDYNFSGGIYGFFEYHFNSAGQSEAKDYLSVLAKAPLRDGFVYLLARHYLNLGMTWRLIPLIPVTAMVIYNVNDGSLILSPVLEYNIADNIYLSAGAYISLGRQPEMVPQVNTSDQFPLLLHSEFGSYPQIIYTSFRVYF